MRPVLGTCGPRHRSSQLVPGVPVAYQLSVALPASQARCALSSFYMLPSPCTFFMHSPEGIS